LADKWDKYARTHAVRWVTWDGRAEVDRWTGGPDGRIDGNAEMDGTDR